MFDPKADGGPFQAFRDDTRAIEGLPIRLVIALVVGVASLSVMMNMLSGVQGLAVVELDAKPSPEVTSPGEQALSFAVVDSDGAPVEGATVVVKSASARLDGIATDRTDANGTATVAVSPTLRANQEEGTLTVSIKPPAGSQFVDRRGNAKVLIVRE